MISGNSTTYCTTVKILYERLKWTMLVAKKETITVSPEMEICPDFIF